MKRQMINRDDQFNSGGHYQDDARSLQALPFAERTSCPDVRSPPRNREGLRSRWYMLTGVKLGTRVLFGLEISNSSLRQVA